MARRARLARRSEPKHKDGTIRPPKASKSSMFILIEDVSIDVIVYYNKSN